MSGSARSTRRSLNVLEQMDADARTQTPTVELAPGFAVVCTDKSVSHAEMEAYAAAQTKQFTEACAAWSRLSVACAYYPDPKAKPAGMPVSTVQVSLDVPEALAYHDLEGDLVVAKTGTQVCAANGVPWQAAASHEAIEALLDAYCNGWAVMPDGRLLVAREACDPVQDGTYEIDGVAMSNYILPAWLDPESRGEQYDRMGVLRSPFTRTAGGYWVEMVVGKTAQVGTRSSYRSSIMRGARRLAAGRP